MCPKARLPQKTYHHSVERRRGQAGYGNHLLRFIEAGFPQNLFKEALYPYNRLSICLQHIAHYVGLIMWSAGAKTA